MTMRFLLLLLPFLPVATTVADPVMMPWVMPQGTLTFSAPLVIEDMDGVTWRGYGSSRVTRLVYTGPPTRGFIQLVGCSRCVLRDFEVVIASPGVDAAILVTNKATPTPGRISNANEFHNVRVMHGGYPTAARRAFSVDSYAAGGRDGNNEQHRFVMCRAHSYSEAGFYVRGSQCHHLVFDQCQASDGGGRRPIGVHAAEGGYLAWRNGNTSANSIDFKFGTFEQMSVISNSRSELSTQFVVMGGGGDAVLTVENCTWDCKPEAGKPTFDGAWPSSIAIRDSWFAGTNGLCPTFRVRGGRMGSLDLSGVLIRQHGGTPPLGPVVSCPTTGDIRVTGLKHQWVSPTGQRVDNKIAVNALGVADAVP